MPAALALLVLGTGASSAATVTGYSSQAAFQAALNTSFTRIGFGDGGFSSPFTPGDPHFLPFGLDVINGAAGFRTFLVNGTDYPAAIGPAPWPCSTAPTPPAPPTISR